MANVLHTASLFCLMLLLHQTEQKDFIPGMEYLVLRSLSLSRTIGNATREFVLDRTVLNMCSYLLKNANQVMQRSKRANLIIIEELLKGNLERECLEEICSYEEARETFEDIEKTNQFWEKYHGGKQCSSDPCMNNAVCKDTIRSYTCSCAEGYKGRNCQFALNECHPHMEDGCQQYCHPGYTSYYCSCAPGYKLGEDEKSCHPEDSIVCGQVNYTTTTLLNLNRTRTFPWQVLLLNSDGVPFCGGVILNQHSVLTTAQCSNSYNPVFVVEAGKIWDKESEKHFIKVKNKTVHTRYCEETGENNIAVLKLQEDFVFHSHCLPICIPQKDFAESVLIPHTTGIVSGLKLLDKENVKQTAFHFPASNTDKETCEDALNVTQTNRMFCGVAQEKIDYKLAGGGHFAMKHNGAWFLTGIMGTWSPTSSTDDVFSFTKISRYIMWLNQSS